MKKIIILFAMALMLNNLNAQFSLTSPKDAQKIKDATLVVAMEEEDAKTVKKLQKKDRRKLKHYKDQIKGRNKALKDAIEISWTFSENIKYLPMSEAEDLVKSNKDKYVLLKFGEYIDYERYKTGLGRNGQPAGWSADRNGNMTYNVSTRYSVLANVITTLEIGDPKSMIKVYLPTVYPSISDAVFGLEQMQYILNYLISSPDHKITKIHKQIKENSLELKDLTLLVDKMEVKKGLTEEEIKEVYHYKFEIVDAEVIDNAILNKDPKYAYVSVVDVPGGKGNVSSHVIMGTGTGVLYRYLMPKVAFGIKGTSIITYNQRVKKNHFEKYIDE